MRLFQSSLLPSSSGTGPSTMSGHALEQYLGNMSEALVRARAERDIHNARAAAEAAIRMRSSFLENMNHELRTPLNAIIGFSGMLEQASDYGLSDDQKKTYAEYIIQSADLLLGHINTILEIAALDNGSVEPTHQAVPLRGLVQEAIKRASIRTKANQIKVKVGEEPITHHHFKDPQDASPLVWADEERIGQAFDHLLQTATKSCGKQGAILVRTHSRQEGWAEIQIRDNGEGFTDQELSDAVQAFGHLNRGLEKPFSGPGVGIAIAKTFIEMQGGQFSIRSRKDKGTLTTISLPFADQEQIASPNPQQAESLEDNTDTHRQDNDIEPLAKSA